MNNDLLSRPPKQVVQLRLPRQVIEFFRAGGTGHITRMQAVLAAYTSGQLLSVGQSAAGLEYKTLPWNEEPLDGWNIVGMNHYFFYGQRHLFVAMMNNRGQAIKAEGPDEWSVFTNLREQANKLEEASKLGRPPGAGQKQAEPVPAGDRGPAEELAPHSSSSPPEEESQSEDATMRSKSEPENMILNAR